MTDQYFGKDKRFHGFNKKGLKLLAEGQGTRTATGLSILHIRTRDKEKAEQIMKEITTNENPINNAVVRQLYPAQGYTQFIDYTKILPPPPIGLNNTGNSDPYTTDVVYKIIKNGIPNDLNTLYEICSQYNLFNNAKNKEEITNILLSVQQQIDNYEKFGAIHLNNFWGKLLKIGYFQGAKPVHPNYPTILRGFCKGFYLQNGAGVIRLLAYKYPGVPFAFYYHVMNETKPIINVCIALASPHDHNMIFWIHRSLRLSNNFYYNRIIKDIMEKIVLSTQNTLPLPDNLNVDDALDEILEHMGLENYKKHWHGEGDLKNEFIKNNALPSGYNPNDPILVKTFINEVPASRYLLAHPMPSSLRMKKLHPQEIPYKANTNLEGVTDYENPRIIHDFPEIVPLSKTMEKIMSIGMYKNRKFFTSLSPQIQNNDKMKYNNNTIINKYTKQNKITENELFKKNHNSLWQDIKNFLTNNS